MSVPRTRMSPPKIWALLAAYYLEDISWVRSNTLQSLCDAGLIHFIGNSGGGDYATTRAGEEWLNEHKDIVRRFRNFP